MKHNKNILRLITPSWVVNVVGVTLAVIGTGVVIILSKYQASDLKLQVFNVKSTAQPATTSTVYQNIADKVASNGFFGAAPLFILWACVGLGIYFFAITIAKSFSDAATLRDELEYVHVSRRSLVREAIFHFVVRVIAILAWFAFIQLSISVIIPYALAFASIASLDLSLQSIGYAVVSAAIIYLDVCVHAVFLRLIALKPRLFG